MGQHFLIDQSVVDRIVESSGVGENAHVLEIGPGKGILTRALLDKGVTLTAIEGDQGLYGGLVRELKGNDHVTLIQDNALIFDFNNLPSPYHVVSNLPYSISVPLVLRLIERGGGVADMTLMVQEEVARRMVAEAGDTHYGSLSAFISYYCNREYLFGVPAEAFRPPPKVDSGVIRLVPDKMALVDEGDEGEFFDFIKGLFAHRRKTIRNNLACNYCNEETVDGALTGAEVEPTLRPQDISLQKYAELFNLIKEAGE